MISLEECKELERRFEPLQGNIIFQFLDETGGKKGEFTSRATESGIVLSTIKDEQKAPRWARVIVASADSDVKAGDYILIAGLMWTTSTRFAGVTFWKTDEDHVLCVTDDVKLTYGSTI